MAERRLGGKLSGKLSPYIPRGAQYDYRPPSVFARYKVLTAVFVILLMALFGYWSFRLHQPRVVPPERQTLPAQEPHPAAQPLPAAQPQSDPVYIEPLAPPK